eukprot:153469-Rhodomonas_salina.1
MPAIAAASAASVFGELSLTSPKPVREGKVSGKEWGQKEKGGDRKAAMLSLHSPCWCRISRLWLRLRCAPQHAHRLISPSSPQWAVQLLRCREKLIRWILGQSKDRCVTLPLPNRN